MTDRALRVALALALVGCARSHEVDERDADSPPPIALDAGRVDGAAVDLGAPMDLPPPDPGCCRVDVDCGDGEVCLNGDPGSATGQCYPAPSGGRCFFDGHCAAGGICRRQTICGHCGGCAVSNDPGLCAFTTVRVPPAAETRLFLAVAIPAIDGCIELVAGGYLFEDVERLSVDTNLDGEVGAMFYGGAAECGLGSRPPDLESATRGSGSLRLSEDGASAAIDLVLTFPVDLPIEGWSIRGTFPVAP